MRERERERYRGGERVFALFFHSVLFFSQFSLLCDPVEPDKHVRDYAVADKEALWVREADDGPR